MPQVTDVDEFELACAAGKLSPEWETQARQTFARLKVEISRGDFQGRFFRM
jgi:predicted RNA-binding protein associated with RNAse of E/G family